MNEDKLNEMAEKAVNVFLYILDAAAKKDEGVTISEIKENEYIYDRMQEEQQEWFKHVYKTALFDTLELIKKQSDDAFEWLERFEDE